MTALAYEPGSEVAVAEDRVEEPRAVIETAFGLLTSLQGLGSARVSDLQRHSGLPRTTVHRLLGQLEDVGSVERFERRWRLGPALMRFGADVPAQPRLRSVARRPLMDLANATGALVALSVEMAGKCVVLDVMPGTRPLAYEPEPGCVLDKQGLAASGFEAAKLPLAARTTARCTATCAPWSTPAAPARGSAASPCRYGSPRTTLRSSGCWSPVGPASPPRWSKQPGAPRRGSPRSCRTRQAHRGHSSEQVFGRFRNSCATAPRALAVGRHETRSS